MANGRDRFQFDEAALAQMENIRRIGLRRLRNKNEIDDFVQETLLRAFSKRSQLRDEAKFEAWIAAIARNLAREWNRAYHRRKRAEASDKTTEAVDSRNPLDALEKAEERELLKRAMTRLNDSDREILRARYLDDASYAELQERYGLSYSAVGQRLHRAKRRLRKIYMSIAAALALFFGSFKHTAWGGMVLMKKTVVIAVAIGVLGGALVGGFLWMRSEGGASLESVDKAGSADSTLTAQTTDDQETLNGANRSASPDSKPEHSEGSRQNESTPSQESDKGVNLNLDTRRFDMTGDIGDFHTAFRETLAAAGRVKEGELKLSELYALIDEYEFNSDWNMYLRIAVMKQLELPISRLEKRFHSRGGDFLTNLLRDRSNAEGAVVGPQLKPIVDTWNWAKEHAPSEYDTVYKRYHRLIRRDAFFGVPLSVEHYLLPEERVSRLYNLFF